MFLYQLFCAACRANVMWTFLFATFFTYTCWHHWQRVMCATLLCTSFTGFTFWHCHFKILLFTNRYFIQISPICKENLIRYNLGYKHAMIVHKSNHCAVVIKSHVEFVTLFFLFLDYFQLVFSGGFGVIIRFTEYLFVDIWQQII